MKLRIRQLEAFQAVAQTGSVTRAAERLGVSQPAVSRLLSDFGKTVGFKLFNRKDGSLVPTSESRYMLVEVSRVFERLTHLEDLRRDLSERKAGHLRIACLPGFATSHLPAVLAEFLKERPGVTVTLEPDRPERILEWIIGQQYDCGITDGFSGHPATESHDIEIRTACILPPGHPLAAKKTISPVDLADENIIHTLRDSHFFGQLSRVFSEYGVAMNSWIEARQFTTACTIVSKGQGASVVSILDAEQFRGTGLVIRPFEPELHHLLSVLRPVSGSRSLLSLDFLEAFVESLRPYMATSSHPNFLTFK